MRSCVCIFPRILDSSCREKQPTPGDTLVRHLTAASIAALALFFAGPARPDTISYWNFESPPFTTEITNRVLGLAADSGNGIGAAFHSSPDSTAFFPVGNGSAHSFASDHWASGDSLMFFFSTTGYCNINLSFDFAADPAGPTNFAVFCSTTRAAVTSLTLRCPVNVNANWNSDSTDPASAAHFDLSSLSEINNSPTVYFELRAWGLAGPNSVVCLDNLLVTGTPVPEPALYGLLVPFGVLFRKRHKANVAPCP